MLTVLARFLKEETHIFATLTLLEVLCILITRLSNSDESATLRIVKKHASSICENLLSIRLREKKNHPFVVPILKTLFLLGYGLKRLEMPYNAALTHGGLPVRLTTYMLLSDLVTHSVDRPDTLESMRKELGKFFVTGNRISNLITTISTDRDLMVKQYASIVLGALMVLLPTHKTLHKTVNSALTRNHPLSERMRDSVAAFRYGVYIQYKVYWGCYFLCGNVGCGLLRVGC